MNNHERDNHYLRLATGLEPSDVIIDAGPAWLLIDGKTKQRKRVGLMVEEYEELIRLRAELAELRSEG